MKAAFRILLSRRYWGDQFSRKRFLRAFFEAVGVIAASLEGGKQLAALVSPTDPWLQTFLVSHYGWTLGGVVATSVVAALYTVWPLTKVSSRLRQRDLTIAIEIGDVFDSRDTLIIGTNCTFDTELSTSLISKNSIQGQFTDRYYRSVQHLDAEIDAALGGIPCEDLEVAAKRLGKRRAYPVGTIALVGQGTRPALFAAIAHMNTHGVARGTMEDLRIALSALWQYIGEKGGGLPSLRTPILGSGFSKIPAPRQVVAKEILRSFVAACVEEKFCDQLTLVIAVRDYIHHGIDLEELGEYLRYLTAYTEIRTVDDAGVGTRIGA